MQRGKKNDLACSEREELKKENRRLSEQIQILSVAL